ncbi:MAG TPA: succinate dehydrogenase/fumarate reductase flavoprotein subunit, partial [Verrucomicrobiae bacterium]|nr:succinate dehydrogenase/fumarate reductase flavoprotein subunit [Verrucomicrobiae bacterium]
RNLLVASDLITRSALMRQDSRGAHFREDFPGTDNDKWLKNIYVGRDGDSARLWTEPIKLTRLQPPVT